MVSFCTHLARRQKIRRAGGAGLALAACLIGSHLPAADTNAVLDHWFAAQKNLQSWSADFVQTRTLKTLTQPLTATGHVDFALPDRFRWELGQPPRTIAVGDGGEMWVIYPHLQRAEHYLMGAKAPRQWHDLISLLQAGLPRSREEFEVQFKIESLQETNGIWQLVLQPKSPSARQMMPQLRLGFAANDDSLASTEMVFVDGSRLRSDYTNAMLNPVLDQSLFTAQPPAGFKITEPLAP